ncbi:uncharacterized protein LOC128385819 [Panonychus citri]|uniref:uncharacterized protein LOC128385819 n=1 Tax=Panonychus citri TaxID=50023 RepID=UPI0023074107|nr:uncharacterized protein LOC128385819 [Panonychus citri]XP_053200730.1 uncharacterized protein LOC128385819 [Panonychus citri]
MDNSIDDSSQTFRCPLADANNNTTNGLTTTTTTTIKSPFCDNDDNLTNCDSQQSTNPLSLISKCSQRAFKSDPDSPWTCPSTNSPQQSTNKHCKYHSNQCLRKREPMDKFDSNDESINCDDCEDDSMLLDIPPEYARDDIELIVDLYIWFEKVRSFLLGLLC